MPDSNNSLLKLWFKEVWNEGNASAIDKFMDEEVILVDEDPSVTHIGSEHVKKVFMNLRKDFKDLHFDVGEVKIYDDVEEAECVVITAMYTNREIEFKGPAKIRVKNGKIIWASNSFDLRLNDKKKTLDSDNHPVTVS